MPRGHDKQRLKEFGAFIRRRREQLGMTQAQVAAAVGLSPQQIATIEQGRSAPSFEATVGLMRFLRIGPGDIDALPVPMPADFSKMLPPVDQMWAAENLAWVRLMKRAVERGLTPEQFEQFLKLMFGKSNKS